MEGRQSTLRLKCSFQSYVWGRSGKESTVAKLYSRNSSDDIDPEMPYAEFWMGTHDSGPSFVVVSSEDSQRLTLKSWIRDNPAVLGHKVTQTWGVHLPFLFKVLSVDKALSIQAHPDKDLARLLHEAHPNIYKDSNHKPEMAVSLTEFKALCGFLTTKELKDVFAAVPEITEIVGSDVAAKFLNSDEEEDDKTLLRSIFTQLMLTGKEKISEMVSKLTKRLNSESEVRMLTVKEELALLLENQYPSDVGVIAAFFFNYVELNPGEALYLGANEPHAYISGECIECMATSDNVVRAGLTPKFRDVETLCSMLTYKQGFPKILQGAAVNPYITRYSPPSDEFEVDLCLLPGDESVAFPAMPGPSIFLVMSGEGRMLAVSLNREDDFPITEGSVFFVPAQTEVKLTSSTSGSLHIYRAGVNSTFLGDSR